MFALYFGQCYTLSMPIGTVHNRIYGGIIIGIVIRGRIGTDKIFRSRKGNGFYNSRTDTRYQDQYDYFVPPSITNVEAEPYRQLLAQGVNYWKNTLSDAQKKAYNRRASKGLRMSGYNLFLREVIKGKFIIP